MENNQLLTLPVPFPNSYWVVPGEFLAGEYPRALDYEYSLQKIRSILDAGIRCFFDLTEKGETNREGVPLVEYESLLKTCCINANRFRFPIPDNSIIPKMEICRILDEIDKQLFDRVPVYLHCWGGHGRTGLIASCWLARNGIVQGEDVLVHLRFLRNRMPDSWKESPETEEQRRIVCSWQKEADIS